MVITSIKQACVESKSMLALKLIKENAFPINFLYHLVRGINDLIKEDWHVKLIHSYKERAIHCVDALTNYVYNFL